MESLLKPLKPWWARASSETPQFEYSINELLPRANFNRYACHIHCLYSLMPRGMHEYCFLISPQDTPTQTQMLLYFCRFSSQCESFEGLDTTLYSVSLLWDWPIIVSWDFFGFARPVPFPPSHSEAHSRTMRHCILLPSLAWLILIVAHRVLGHSSGAPEESCDSLTVRHTHVGQPVPGLSCGPPCLTRQLRLIDSSADSFTYNCNETYQCELAHMSFVSDCNWSLTMWVQISYIGIASYPCWIVLTFCRINKNKATCL